MTYVDAHEAPGRNTGAIKIHRPADFDGMRRAGRLAAETLDFIAPFVRPGVTTEELDGHCHKFILERNALPAPLNYRAPVNAARVNILLSTDGGNTFAYELALNTPNDGAETVLIPEVVTAAARLKVEAVGNIFFDISAENLAAGSCHMADTPQVDTTVPKNRFISFIAGGAGVNQAVRVTFIDLPAPYDVFNGMTMWVGQPRDVSENGASVEPLPGFPNFKAALLQCSPFFADFGAMGTIHMYHEELVPDGIYEVQAIVETCDVSVEQNFSDPSVAFTSLWGDTIKDCTTVPCGPPEGIINIVDVSAILDEFVTAPDSIIKARADLEPGCPDLVINIADALSALAGFQGLGYGFEPSSEDPCDAICARGRR